MGRERPQWPLSRQGGWLKRRRVTAQHFVFTVLTHAHTHTTQIHTYTLWTHTCEQTHRHTYTPMHRQMYEHSPPTHTHTYTCRHRPDARSISTVHGAQDRGETQVSREGSWQVAVHPRPEEGKSWCKAVRSGLCSPSCPTSPVLPLAPWLGPLAAPARPGLSPCPYLSISVWQEALVSTLCSEEEPPPWAPQVPSTLHPPLPSPQNPVAS